MLCLEQVKFEFWEFVNSQIPPESSCSVKHMLRNKPSSLSASIVLVFITKSMCFQFTAIIQTPSAPSIVSPNGRVCHFWHIWWLSLSFLQHMSSYGSPGGTWTIPVNCVHECLQPLPVMCAQKETMAPSPGFIELLMNIIQERQLQLGPKLPDSKCKHCLIVLFCECIHRKLP